MKNERLGTTESGPTNPKHWITRGRLYAGAAQPNGGLADTLVYEIDSEALIYGPWGFFFLHWR